MKKITKEEIRNFLKGNMNSIERMTKISNAQYELDSTGESFCTKKELVDKIYNKINNN